MSIILSPSPFETYRHYMSLGLTPFHYDLHRQLRKPPNQVQDLLKYYGMDYVAESLGTVGTNLFSRFRCTFVTYEKVITENIRRGHLPLLPNLRAIKPQGLSWNLSAEGNAGNQEDRRLFPRCSNVQCEEARQSLSLHLILVRPNTSTPMSTFSRDGHAPAIQPPSISGGDPNNENKAFDQGIRAMGGGRDNILGKLPLVVDVGKRASYALNARGRATEIEADSEMIWKTIVQGVTEKAWGVVDVRWIGEMKTLGNLSIEADWNPQRVLELRDATRSAQISLSSHDWPFHRSSGFDNFFATTVNEVFKSGTWTPNIIRFSRYSEALHSSNPTMKMNVHMMVSDTGRPKNNAFPRDKFNFSNNQSCDIAKAAERETR
ncbi:hypothetical protein BDP27DRAFT_1370980 [Rhodocollybia butyracea]|uniref:Uncharacterized protein n=1 Tax=Rhodocollybia butyracea TaxID=206335 RepID=A0A9P5P7Z2_9AGAR|nr:hypothetical protein BDP27DRAFT_1370980 [Rhodocollybia butyracea]